MLGLSNLFIVIEIYEVSTLPKAWLLGCYNTHKNQTQFPQYDQIPCGWGNIAGAEYYQTRKILITLLTNTK